MADLLTPLPVKTKTPGDVANNLVQVGGASITLGSKTSSASLPVVIASDQGAVAVDSELPAAVALSDTLGNPTAPAVGGYMLAWNGSTWQRVKVDASGFVEVNVSSGGSAAVSPQHSTLTTASLAVSASTDLDATQITTGKTGNLLQVTASSSVPLKVVVKTQKNSVLATIAVFFTTASEPTLIWTPPAKNLFNVPQVSAADNYRVTITNMDNANAADVYTTVTWDEV